MSEKLSPMQKAAHIPRGFIQCPDGITIQHWSKALDEALRILRNDDALDRMDATARAVMAALATSVSYVDNLNQGGIYHAFQGFGGVVGDASERLEAPRGPYRGRQGRAAPDLL